MTLGIYYERSNEKKNDQHGRQLNKLGQCSHWKNLKVSGILTLFQTIF